MSQFLDINSHHEGLDKSPAMDCVTKTNPAVLRVFTTFELIEPILLRLPPTDVIICQRVHPYWRSIFKSSSVIQTHCSDTFVIKFSLSLQEHVPLISTPSPFYDARRNCLADNVLTEGDFLRYRHAAVLVSRRLSSANYKTSLLTTCGLCRHPHERFVSSLLHPQLRIFCSMDDRATGLSTCFTAYKSHVVLQLRIPAVDAIDQLLVFLKDLSRHVSQKCDPMAKPSPTKISIYISGIAGGFRSLCAQEKCTFTLGDIVRELLGSLQETCMTGRQHLALTLKSCLVASRAMSSSMRTSSGSDSAVPTMPMLTARDSVWAEWAQTLMGLGQLWKSGDT